MTWNKWIVLTVGAASSAVVMLLLPWLAARVVNGDNGMALCFLLWYLINPLFSILSGGFAGKKIKSFWILSFLPPAFFLLGIALLFGLSEPLFIKYTVEYLILSAGSMLIIYQKNKAENKA